jgi:hypothetical protein
VDKLKEGKGYVSEEEQREQEVVQNKLKDPFL